MEAALDSCGREETAGTGRGVDREGQGRGEEEAVGTGGYGDQGHKEQSADSEILEIKKSEGGVRRDCE